jgi:hypothetical protein
MLTIEALVRRIATPLGLVGAILLIVGGFTSHGQGNWLSYVGVALGVVTWILALVITVLNRTFGWLALLLLIGAAGPLIGYTLANGLVGFTDANGLDLALLVLPLTLIGFVVSLSHSRTIVQRSTAAALGGLSIAVIMVGGTLTSGGGTNAISDQGVVNLGTHIYLVAAIFGLVAWLIGIVVAARNQAWGWLVATVLLLNVGGFMLGLFGPTKEDVRQSRLQRQARRAAEQLQRSSVRGAGPA